MKSEIQCVQLSLPGSAALHLQLQAQQHEVFKHGEALCCSCAQQHRKALTLTFSVSLSSYTAVAPSPGEQSSHSTYKSHLLSSQQAAHLPSCIFLIDEVWSPRPCSPRYVCIVRIMSSISGGSFLQMDPKHFTNCCLIKQAKLSRLSSP